MGCRRLRLPIFLAALSLVLFGLGCIFGTDEEDPIGDPPPEIPPPTSTENLVKGLEVTYTDKVRSATERKQVYENLLAKPPACDTCRAFLFDFQPADEDQGTPASWGRSEEVASAENIFQAQENGGIFELTLTIESLPEEEIVGDPEKEGWHEVFATNVHLRLLTTPQDGFEVIGGQAQFQAYQYDNRWWLAEWIDLPRP
jgi:hypothetical protein